MIRFNQVDIKSFNSALMPVYNSALDGEYGTDGIQIVIYDGAIWKALQLKADMGAGAPTEGVYWTQIAGNTSTENVDYTQTEEDTGGTSDYYTMPTFGEYIFKSSITLDTTSYFIITDSEIKFILNDDTANPIVLVTGVSGLRLVSADSALAGVKVNVNGIIIPPSALRITQNNDGNPEDKVEVYWSRAFNDSTAQMDDVLVIDVPRKIVVTN